MKAGTSLQVLFVDDSEDDTMLLLDELRHGGYEPVWERVETAAALRAALSCRQWELVLCDYVMPQFSGPAALSLVQQQCPDVPVIIVSGQVGEEYTVAAMKAGARDYVMKSNLARLTPAIERELREAKQRQARARDVTELKRAEEQKTALLDLARAVTGTLDLGVILDQAQRQASALLPCEYVATFYLDAGRGRFRLVAQHGLPEGLRVQAMELEFAPGQPIIEWVRAGRTVVINDVGAQRLLPVGLLARFEVAAMIGVPLAVRGQLMGVIVAVRPTAGCSFDTREVELFEAIAGQVALAVGTAELYRAQEEEAHVSAALARVAQELIVSLDRPVLLDRLCRLTTEVLGCDCSHTAFWDSEHEAFTVVAGSGDPPEQWEAIRVLTVPRQIVEGLITELRRADIARVAEPQNLMPVGLLTQYGITASLYGALRCGTKLIGVHTASYRKRDGCFTASQERIFRGILHIASLAIEHARVVEELERANRLKYDFLATMSHELRTPLNAILGYTDLVLQGEFGPVLPAQADVFRRVDKSAHELYELITATLDLSRLEAGRFALDLRDVRLTELAHEIDVETHAPQRKPGIEMTWRVPADLPMLHTDPLKLKVVIKNLIANAFKFTEEGGVTVSAAARNGGVEIAVSDTGIGIAPEALAIIFEPFRQVDNSTTRRYGGVGLGLYVVRRLVDSLGARIEVESELGRGSTFRVWLPTGRSVTS